MRNTNNFPFFLTLLIIAVICLRNFLPVEKETLATSVITTERAPSDQTVPATPRVVTIQPGKGLVSLGISKNEADDLAARAGIAYSRDSALEKNPIVHTGDQFILLPRPGIGDSIWYAINPVSYVAIH